MNDDIAKMLKQLDPIWKQVEEMERHEKLFGPLGGGNAATDQMQGEMAKLLRAEDELRSLANAVAGNRIGNEFQVPSALAAAQTIASELETRHRQETSFAGSINELDTLHPTRLKVAALTGNVSLAEAENLGILSSLQSAIDEAKRFAAPSLKDVVEPNGLGSTLADQINKSILDRNAGIRSAFTDPVPLLTHTTALQLQQYAQALDSTHGLHSAFVRPEPDTIGSLLGTSFDDYLKKHGAITHSERVLESALQAIDRMNTPWMSVQHPERSINALFGLSTIGSALRDPSSSLLGEITSREFGNWSRLPSLASKLDMDAGARERLYLENGFNRKLLELPEMAFDEALVASGLAETNGDSVAESESVEDVEQELRIIVHTEDDVERAAVHQLFDAFDSLEKRLRKFIHFHMAQHYGSEWIERKVDGRTRREWQATAKRYENRGGQRLPILHHSTFAHLQKILCDHYAPVFEPYLHILGADLETVLNRLRLARNDVAHFKQLPPVERPVVWTHIRQLGACLRMV